MKKIIYLWLPILSIFQLNAQELYDDNKISEDEFFNEKKDPDYLKRLNIKYSRVLTYIDFKTGDERRCFRKWKYSKQNKNQFIIVNNDATATDLWCRFFNISKSQYPFLVRECFVKHGESHTVKFLESGDYKLEIIHGTHWRQPLQDTGCSGQFSQNSSVTSMSISKKYSVGKYSVHKYISNNTE